eukprot:TRINITY_DN32194_c0_g1_i1.p1 TRINITY_DN32194_c0_g1~~TRINITY_DN32194_c0_g1_i1.p1  ORF type:complete len:257 (-),score=-12.59 TRINITY_DN32194_c0_g1_i1:713-1399(-)
MRKFQVKCTSNPLGFLISITEKFKVYFLSNIKLYETEKSKLKLRLIVLEQVQTLQKLNEKSCKNNKQYTNLNKISPLLCNKHKMLRDISVRIEYCKLKLMCMHMQVTVFNISIYRKNKYRYIDTINISISTDTAIPSMSIPCRSKNFCIVIGIGGNILSQRFGQVNDSPNLDKILNSPKIVFQLSMLRVFSLKLQRDQARYYYYQKIVEVELICLQLIVSNLFLQIRD